ncbi:hypothetical protein TRVA0_004S00804 [Trichomonascus vanleenenianus]|uniref:uncharacterized protein n=1 Tax=Trichomonascus vanleenenianus TaxID=2268995 RepID=UPI003EC96841
MALAKAIKGATKTKEAPPKGKYVVAVQNSVRENHSDADLDRFLFGLLQARLYDGAKDHQYSLVSLKAHILFHTHVLSDNNYSLPKYRLWKFVTEEQCEDAILPKLDKKIPLSCAQHRLAVAYNRYLCRRLADFSRLGIDPIREKRDFCSIVDSAVTLSHLAASTDLLAQTQCVLSQVKLILDCIFTQELLDSPLYLCCYNLLATDLATLFSFLNLAVVQALQSFFSLARADAERTLFIYKEYTQLQIAQEVLVFTRLAHNMASPTELVIPTPLQQSAQSIEQLTRALESYLFTNRDSDESLHTRNNRSSARTTSTSSTTPTLYSKDDAPQTPASARTPVLDGAWSNIFEALDSSEPKLDLATTFTINDVRHPVPDPPAPPKPKGFMKTWRTKTPI